ncbi:ribonuclease HI family protein [bacterium]|nr:ribonuclease HI family protein [bacterium]
MTLFKVRLELNLTAGGSRLLVAEAQRPPLLVLDSSLTWRERVGVFSAKVLGLAPVELRLSEAHTLVEGSGEAELRLYVDCRVESAATPLDERLVWVGAEGPDVPAPAAEKTQSCAGLDPSRPVQLYTDGGSRGNPGPAGIGVLLSQGSDGWEQELAAHIGRATNNVAEYTALVEGLRLARQLGVRRVEHFADSELMVRQLLGQYKVKSPELRELLEQVRALVTSFDSFSTRHVRRELNTRADSLVNRALDQAAKESGQ